VRDSINTHTYKPLREELFSRRRLSEIQALFHQFIGIHTFFHDASGALLVPLEEDRGLREMLASIDEQRRTGRFSDGGEIPLANGIVMRVRNFGGRILEYEIPFATHTEYSGCVRMISKAASDVGAGGGPAEAQLQFVPREEVIRHAAAVIPLIETFLLMGERIQVLENIVDGFSALRQTGQLLANSLNLEEVLSLIVSLVVETVGVKGCSLRLLNEETGKLEIRATKNLSAKYLEKGPVVAIGSEIDVAAMKGETVVIEDLRNDPRVLYPAEMIEEGLVSILCVGVRMRERPIGVIRAYSAQMREFSAYDLFLLEALANYAAIAIDYARRFADSLEKRRIDQEFNVAASIQKRLMPPALPRWPGYDITAVNIPHRQVGGDFYDLWDMPEENLGIIIADGSGKSVSGALLMTLAHTAVRVQAQYVYRTADIIARTNRFICSQTRQRHFVSLFYAALNRRDRILTYTNAGHTPPVILGSSGARLLEASGMVLGVEPETSYFERQVALVPGDLLIMCTDGVTEALSPNDELFGGDRLVEVVQTCRQKSAAEIIRITCEELRRFVDKPIFPDDLTLMVLKVL